jgi:hypothetical protein
MVAAVRGDPLRQDLQERHAIDRDARDRRRDLRAAHASHRARANEPTLANRR